MMSEGLQYTYAELHVETISMEVRRLTPMSFLSYKTVCVSVCVLRTTLSQLQNSLQPRGRIVLLA